MEDALHCNSDGMVVGVDRFWVVRAAGWAEWLSGGEKGFDGFVSQNEQRGHRPQTSWQRFVAAGGGGAGEGLFFAGVFLIVRRVGGGGAGLGVFFWAVPPPAARGGGGRGGGG